MTTALLTGGSGFIGTYIARWLLAGTDAQIEALVRGKDDKDAGYRLARAWSDLPSLAEEIGARVKAVAGDVTQEHLGLDEQKRAYLPRLASGEIVGSFALTEPEAGSDAGSLRTTARRNGDHYVLNGTKRFITNAPHAGLFTVFARTRRRIVHYL